MNVIEGGEPELPGSAVGVPFIWHMAVSHSESVFSKHPLGSSLRGACDPHGPLLLSCSGCCVQWPVLRAGRGNGAVPLVLGLPYSPTQGLNISTLSLIFFPARSSVFEN